MWEFVLLHVDSTRRSAACSSLCRAVEIDCARSSSEGLLVSNGARGPGATECGRSGCLTDKLAAPWVEAERAGLSLVLRGKQDLTCLLFHCWSYCSCVTFWTYSRPFCLWLQSRVIAVLDWELSTVGHPLSDLAHLSSFYFWPQTVPVLNQTFWFQEGRGTKV